MFIRAVIFVLVFPLLLGLAKNNYDIIIHNVECILPAKKYVSFLECKLLRQRSPVVAAQFMLNETINHFDMHCTFDLFKKDKTRMNIADIKMDGCKYLGSMYQNNIIGKLFKRLKTVSNIPNNCPVEKGKMFEIRNYTFIADEFPPGAPQAKWQMRLKLLRRSDLIITIIFDGSVVYKT
ncbi:uncharacterized protein [Drosophila kikkawai]|uniref:MD-2-related lipid-recognition domain-containing protein n=1 Tax=Drosophila kikkawai TaxID=30033 RepID=A0ABM4GEJ3_DROKI